MKTAITFLAALLVFAGWTSAAEPDQEAVLAEWEGGNITVGEYAHWWERLTPDARPDLSTMEAKADFLNNMINAKIMLAEAEVMGVPEHPNVKDWVHSRRVSALRERLYQEATKGRLEVDEAEVTKIYEKRLTQITASHLITPTYDKALAMLDSLAAGIPFEDLARTHSTCASGARGGALGPVRWEDFTDRWSTRAFALEPGEVSQPFEVEGGYAIVKVHDKTLLEPQNPEAEKQGIRATLLKRDNFDEREAFLDSLKFAYEVDIDIETVVSLCARYVQAMTDRGITSEVVAEDIVPPLTESEKQAPVVTFRGGSFSTVDVVDIILAQPYVVRPRLDDPDEMFNFISRQLNDTLLVREADKREIGKIPEIADNLEKITQNRILTRFYRVKVQDVEIPEDTLRTFYDTNKDSYVSTPGHLASKIVLTSREAADSVLQMIENGASFEEIAKERSIDPFTAPEGGDMGFYPPGKDAEFDGFFDQLEVGEKGIFRSVEGHVVLWLRERHGKRQLSYEEAKPAVVRDVSRRFKAYYLNDWLEEKRGDLGVTVYEDALAGVTLP
jgi:parvulin-like peptidyl-prolyl isomerase